MTIDVKSRLLAHPGAKYSKGRVTIRCPFHNDRNPSLSVRVEPPYLGAFRCWSCNAKGGLTKLFEKLGESLAGDDVLHATPVASADSVDPGDESMDFYPLNARNAKRLGLKNNQWRGFDIEFLATIVKAKIAYLNDPDIDEWRRSIPHLFLPVLIQGQQVGYIKAALRKTKKGKSYFNRPGNWSSSNGLFMFDQAVQLMNDLDIYTIVLVEGPRDALRLIFAGIPAVAMLGTQSWSEIKSLNLLKSGATRIVLCMDGDDAGELANSLMRPQLKSVGLSVKSFKLWEWEGEYDPCSMPNSLLKRLRRIVLDT